MVSSNFIINNVNHMGITVRSLSESLKFWEGLLGGEILTRNQMAMRPDLNVIGVVDAVMENVLVKLPDGSRIELLEYSAPADRKVYKPRGCECVFPGIGGSRFELIVNSQYWECPCCTGCEGRRVAD